MKKAFTLITLLIMTIPLFSQELSQKKTKEYYLHKSKNQKSAGFVLLAGGGALIIAGVAIGSGEETSFDDAGTGVVLAGLGLVSMLTSIPLFLASGKNKRRGNNMTASIILEDAKSFSLHGLVSKQFPALSLRLRL